MASLRQHDSPILFANPTYESVASVICVQTLGYTVLNRILTHFLLHFLTEKMHCTYIPYRYKSSKSTGTAVLGEGYCESLVFNVGNRSEFDGPN